MYMKQWFSTVRETQNKKALPILSFPAITLMDISVKALIVDSCLQAEGMKRIADRCETLASVSLMDLSVEAEAFGATIRVDGHEVPTVYGSLINTAADAEQLRVPSVGAGRTGLYIDAIHKACTYITDRPVFGGTIGPFSLCGRLMDMTAIMMNCYDEPEMVHTCLSKAAEFLTAYTLAYKKAGAHGIVMAEPAAGLLSPALIDEFSTPYVQQIIDAVQSDDFAFIYHNCGKTLPLLDSIKKINAYGFHFGNAVDITEVLPAMPTDTLVLGNIDPAGQFRNGTPDSIYTHTTALLQTCGHIPNFVISSGCDIPPVSPWENTDAFFKAVSDFYRA